MSLYPVHRSCRTRGNFLPRLEVLDERCLPACFITQNGNLLKILGSEGKDVLRVGDDGSGDIAVLCDKNPMAQVFHGINKIDIETRGGSDVIRYELLGNVTGQRNLTVDLGTGADTFHAFLNQNDLNPQANYRLNIKGGSGADVLRVDYRKDPDTATVDQLSKALNLLTFAPAAFVSFGGFGTPGVDIPVSAAMTINLDGGPGDDRLSVLYQGDLQGKLSVTANGGPGKDHVFVDITTTTQSAGKVFARAFGGPGNDTLTLNVRQQPGICFVTPCGILVDALIDGGSGINHARHTLNVLVRNCQFSTIDT